MAIRATGAAELTLIAAACRKESNGRQIIRDMQGMIRRSAGPAIRREVRVHVMATLPKRGGLNAWVARAPVRIDVLTGGSSARVRVKVGRNSMTGRADLRGLDAGGVRHPLFGNRGRWYGNAVVPESISDGITEEGADQLERAVLFAVERMAARIVGA